MAEDSREPEGTTAGGDAADPSADAAAELLTAVLAGRLDRVMDQVLATQPPAVRAELVRTTEAVSMLARGAVPLAPPPGLRERILRSAGAARARPVRRALVVVDMINDYLTPGRSLEVPRAREVVPALRRRLDEARAAGMPIVYVVDRHEPDDPDLDVWGAHAIAGSEGTEVWPALAPGPGDPVVGHPTYSGFVRSELDATLRAHRVDTLVLTGCLTELQLFATGLDALQRGYAVELPDDCHAGANPVAEQVALGVLRLTRPYAPARLELLAAVAA